MCGPTLEIVLALVVEVDVRSHSVVVVVAPVVEVDVRSHSGSRGGSRRGGKCKVPLCNSWWL